jgi:hypothetical protein
LRSPAPDSGNVRRVTPLIIAPDIGGFGFTDFDIGEESSKLFIIVRIIFAGAG